MIQMHYIQCQQNHKIKAEESKQRQMKIAFTDVFGDYIGRTQEYKRLASNQMKIEIVQSVSDEDMRRIKKHPIIGPNFEKLTNKFKITSFYTMRSINENDIKGQIKLL